MAAMHSGRTGGGCESSVVRACRMLSSRARIGWLSGSPESAWSCVARGRRSDILERMGNGEDGGRSKGGRGKGCLWRLQCGLTVGE